MYSTVLNNSNTSSYNTNNGDRYRVPYGSTYNNDITTASFSFNVSSGGSALKNTIGWSSAPLSLYKSSSFKGTTTSATGNNTGAVSSALSYSTYMTNNSLRQSTPLSTSRSNLSCGSKLPYSAASKPLLSSYGSNCVGKSSTSMVMALASRSNSLREQERKSRTRSRTLNAAQRSFSAWSKKSEGYEVRWWIYTKSETLYFYNR